MRKARLVKALRDAVQLMNDVGAHWTKGELRDKAYDSDTDQWVDEYRYCSLGAIYEVTGVSIDKIEQTENAESYDPAAMRQLLFRSGEYAVRENIVRTLAKEIEADQLAKGEVVVWPNNTTQECEYTITHWNDKGTRTWDEVVEMFERAAKKIEAGGTPTT